MSATINIAITGPASVDLAPLLALGERYEVRIIRAWIDRGAVEE